MKNKEKMSQFFYLMIPFSIKKGTLDSSPKHQITLFCDPVYFNYSINDFLNGIHTAGNKIT